MGNRYDTRRSKIDMDGLLCGLRSHFDHIPDPRNRIIGQSLSDICMSALAMFSLKYPSLLQFDTQTEVERQNLKAVFGLDQVCSDTQMRRMLDQVDPVYFRDRLADHLGQLDDLGILREYQVLRRYSVVSIDGVEHFRSGKVHCERCLQRRHRDGQLSYSHSMLCAALVHPDEAEVFVVDAEPIVQQDGTQKNDCESNAAARLVDRLAERHPQRDLLLVQDALYATGPYLSRLLERDYAFVIGVKPDSHTALFNQFNGRRDRGQTQELSWRAKGEQHRLRWSNDLALNDEWPDLRVNLLYYEVTDRRGKTTTFSWVSSVKISRRNAEMLMRIGRSRWKIENETFNTLKNQGYHFEHNYGHGKQHLATGLAYLMLLAFLMDQIIQKCSQDFKLLWRAAKTKAKLWFTQRSVFTTLPCSNFREIYKQLALLFKVQLE